MATFTLAIPEDLKKKIDSHPEINWPEYLKQRFETRIHELRKFEKLKKIKKEKSIKFKSLADLRKIIER